MSTSQKPYSRTQRARYLPYALVVLTALACAAALFLRGHLYGRWWAHQAAQREGFLERLALADAIAELGDAGRWGVSVLLSDDDVGVRQTGVLVLQRWSTPWASQRLHDALHDADLRLREMAALTLADRGDATVLASLPELWAEGDDSTAAVVAAALLRLGTPEADALLVKLAADDVEAEKRAALIPALAERATPACVEALRAMRSDERLLPVGVTTTAASAPAAATVAERATAALENLADDE